MITINVMIGIVGLIDRCPLNNQLRQKKIFDKKQNVLRNIVHVTDKMQEDKRPI